MTGAALSAASLVLYVVVMAGQDDRPLVWVVAVLVAGGLLAAYGAVMRAPLRTPALAAAAALLGVLGLLALLTIGVVILLAASFVLVALLRALTRPVVDA